MRRQGHELFCVPVDIPRFIGLASILHNQARTWIGVGSLAEYNSCSMGQIGHLTRRIGENVTRFVRGCVTARHHLPGNTTETERNFPMTKSNLSLTSSIFAWIAFVFVACFIVATQNNTTAYWTVDLNYALDQEHRGCLSGAQSGYDVDFGLAQANLRAAQQYARNVYIQNKNNGEVDADQEYARALEIATNTFNNAVRSAESIANGVVRSCDNAAEFREQQRERERAAEEARQRAAERDDEEDDYSEDEDENERENAMDDDDGFDNDPRNDDLLDDDVDDYLQDDYDRLEELEEL